MCIRDRVKDRINGIADRRCDIRYSEYKNETATYINDAKLKFEDCLLYTSRCV